MMQKYVIIYAVIVLSSQHCHLDWKFMFTLFIGPFIKGISFYFCFEYCSVIFVGEAVLGINTWSYLLLLTVQ